jgi:hypothetical protein
VSGLTIRTSQYLQGEFWVFYSNQRARGVPVCVTINGIVEHALCWLGTLMKDACGDPHTFVGPNCNPRQIFRCFPTRSNRYLINAVQTRRIVPFVSAMRSNCPSFLLALAVRTARTDPSHAVGGPPSAGPAVDRPDDMAHQGRVRDVWFSLASAFLTLPVA